jgi:uncharacterized protein (TIGR02594 family)
MPTALPAWLAFARSLIGTAEIPGPKNSPTIMGWIKALGTKVLGIAVFDDETAWCGIFMAWCMRSCMIDPPPIAVRASSWSTWGRPCSPGVGSVLVFKRPGGGHVGFYTGERPDAYRVLGGNTGNRVAETWIAKDRLVASRWPVGVPIDSRPLKLAANGAPLSTNEA